MVEQVGCGRVEAQEHLLPLLQRLRLVGLHLDLLAVEALKMMEARKITSVVVVDAAGRVEGVVHLHDLWRTQMV